jgi:hypothetical protein
LLIKNILSKLRYRQEGEVKFYKQPPRFIFKNILVIKSWGFPTVGNFRFILSVLKMGLTTNLITEVRKGNIEWTFESKSNACTSMFDEGGIYRENEKFKNNQSENKYEKTELEEYLLLKYEQIGSVNYDRVINVRNPSVLKLVIV